MKASDSAPQHREFGALVRLATPIAIVQLGMMAMGLVDTAMLGRVSSLEVAACGLANSYSWLVANFGMGVLLALDPILSQALGARDDDAFASGLKRGFLIAAMLTIPSSIAWMFTAEALTFCDQSPELIPLADLYVETLIPSLFPFFGFIVLRVALQAMHRIAPLVIVTILANVANALLDAVLIHGSFGFEAMGIEGCGHATTICRILMFLALLALAWPRVGPALRRPVRLEGGLFALRPILRILRVGVPIGLHMLTELGAFVLVMLRMGHLGDGVTPVAGHVIAIQLAAFSFMMPLGVSIAASVRVGWAVGEGDRASVRRRAHVALGTGAAIMALWGLLFWLVPGPLVRIFSAEDEVLMVALTLMPSAALFQVFDGIQVVASGALRGLGDTMIPAISHFAGFWLLGIPIGDYLAFEAGYGPAGLWWGLVIGLFVSAVILVTRMEIRIRGPVERI